MVEGSLADGWPEAPGFDAEPHWRAIEADDVATLIYTSGTTGPPKGVQLTHRNVIACARSIESIIQLPDGARVISWLPAAHIAERMVTAELAAARKQPDDAVAALREAVAIEDRIPYDEPPGWHAPVRQTLGAVLLDAGRAADAERVYREELHRNPGNGWSLFGLAQSLRAQGKEPEAARVQHDFATAWRDADVRLTASRM